MSTQSLPAPSLRPGISLPAARLVRWVVNYMIYKAVWLIMPAIFGAEPSFLPALRETPRPSALNVPCLDCASPKAGAIDCRWTDPRTLLAKLLPVEPRHVEAELLEHLAGGLHERNRSTEIHAAAFQLLRVGNQLARQACSMGRVVVELTTPTSRREGLRAAKVA